MFHIVSANTQRIAKEKVSGNMKMGWESEKKKWLKSLSEWKI